MKFYKIGALLFLLGGCTPKVADWTPAESPKENKVERVVFTHFIHYPARAREMGKTEKKRFIRFLKTTVLRPSAVSVILVEYGGQSKKRIKDVRRELIMYGVPYEFIMEESEVDQRILKDCRSSYQYSRKSSEGGIEVIVERYVVIPPACADFSQPIGDARQQYSHSNHGCADAVNMGMMIANPRDLISGRPLGESDGQVIAAGVQRYRQDKVKALIDTSTTVDPGQLSSTTGTTTSTGVGASPAGAY